jgi:hypothetical protein
MKTTHNTRRNISSRSSLIRGKKWFKTADGRFTYTYFERNLSNREHKEELVKELRKRQLDVSVLCKKVLFKHSGAQAVNYFVTIPSTQFCELFSTITPQPSKINFPENVQKEAVEEEVCEA